MPFGYSKILSTLDSVTTTVPSNEALFASVSRLQLVKYFSAASLMLQVTDYVLSLDDEISMIWYSPWSLTKVLYLLARYSPFINLPVEVSYYTASHPSSSLCAAHNWTLSVFTIFGVCVSEAILIMRTYAMYNCDKRLLIFLLTLFGALIAAVLPITIVFLQSVEYGPPIVQGLRGCHPIRSSKIIFIVFVILMFFETTIVVLTLYSALKHERSRTSHPIFKTLYKDGFLFFACIFLVTLANILCMSTFPPELLDLFDGLQSALHSILSTKIILHLRKHCATDYDRSRIVLDSVGMEFMDITTDLTDRGGGADAYYPYSYPGSGEDTATIATSARTSISDSERPSTSTTVNHVSRSGSAAHERIS